MKKLYIQSEEHWDAAPDTRNSSLSIQVDLSHLDLILHSLLPLWLSECLNPFLQTFTFPSTEGENKSI